MLKGGLHYILIPSFLVTSLPQVQSQSIEMDCSRRRGCYDEWYFHSTWFIRSSMWFVLSALQG